MYMICKTIANINCTKTTTKCIYCIQSKQYTKTLTGSCASKLLLPKNNCMKT